MKKQRLRDQLNEQREYRRQAQNIRWRNPVQDQSVNDINNDTRSYGTEKDSSNCAFFLKTGSCRYGDACSKFHPYPPVSTTLLIKNMYDGPGMSEPTDEDNDDDLEHSEEEIRDHFEQFWHDIVPEFRRYGEIEQLRVCRNHSHHLRGNVYIMYKNQEEALRAHHAFHGRFYAGKKLIVQFSPVVNWKSAVCGLFTRRQCERGKQCNFLHVFANPNGELDGRDLDKDRDRDRDTTNRDRDRERPSHRDRDNHRDRDTHRDRHRDKERDSRDKYRDSNQNKEEKLKEEKKSKEIEEKEREIERQLAEIYADLSPIHKTTNLENSQSSKKRSNTKADEAQHRKSRR